MTKVPGTFCGSRRVLNFTVAFDDADGEGIVFFGNYFRLAHRALEAYLPTIGIPWKEWYANPDWGVPLRHTEAEYMQPLRPGDEFTVTINVTELGESSVHFEFDFAKGGMPTAKVKTSHVFVARPDFRKITIPDSIRNRLQKNSP